MSRLENKWVLITGASRGVGRQIALALVEHKANLILHSRDTKHCEALLSELKSKGIKAHALAAELSDPEQVQAMLRQAEEISGGIDVVFNNAAIQAPWREAHTTTVEDYRENFEINVIALAKICDFVIPGMKARGYGRIINTTSGIENIPELLPYSMSKAAVDRYVRDLVPSLKGTGVVMSLLDPGWLKTDLGGENAPNEVETVLPGALVPALFDDDEPSGQLIRAQDYRTDQ
jgi:NAD(P)-dependent dehydrogenase (short-subunit alcohol dehydrogenase family)